MFIDFLFCVGTTSPVKSSKHNTSSICPHWLPWQHEGPGIKGLWWGQAKPANFGSSSKNCPLLFSFLVMKVLIEWSLWKAWEILSSQNLCFSDETNRTCSMAPLVLVSWSYRFSGSRSWPLQPAPFLPLWCPEEEENQSCLSKSSTTPDPRLSPCHRVEKTQNQKGQKHHVLFGGLEKQNGHCSIPTQIASHYQQGNQSSE